MEGLQAHLGRVLREAAFWLIVGAALYLVVSLAGYDPRDPGWSYLGPASGVHNPGGRAGAWIGDVLLFLLGWFAYLVPVMLVWTAVLVFRRPHRLFNDNLYLLALRWSGFFITLAAGTGLFEVRSVPSGMLPAGAGGALGAFLGDGLAASFNRPGATLLLLAVLLSGLTLFTGLSWLRVLEAVGAATLWLGRRAGALLRERLRAWRPRSGPDVVRREPLLVEGAEVVEPLSEPLVVEAPPSVPAPAVKTRAEKEAPASGRTQGEAPETKDAAGKKVPVTRRPREEAPLPLLEPDPDSALPSLALLDEPRHSSKGYSEEDLQEMSRLVEARLADFRVQVEVVAVHPGPVVTLFELSLAPGTKVAKITGLAKDLARALSSISVRVVEVIPGKPVIGLEVPNREREMVFLSEILRSRAYERSKSPLTLALGKDIGGNPVVADLGKMPHVLIAGTTGSGKSVAINAMILSLLYKALPSEVRLIMIDPKMLELSVYEGIPHLLTPVVTDMKEAANALRWCVGEMERRYRLMSALGVRNIAGYNRVVAQAEAKGEPIPDPLFDPEQDFAGTGPEPLARLPYIVIVIDELADMMMVVGKKVEELIARLAQKARASGIHLLLATQRPSVDVLTGLIKANIPTRIAFQVSSRIDSRTVLDQMGAEHLLGHGDMLYLPPGSSLTQRLHGAFVDDAEVHRVVESLKQHGGPDYIEDVLQESSEPIPGIDAVPGGGDVEDQDPLFDEAVKIVVETRRASISGVQRRLKVGYNRAARMIEEMERIGLVGPLEANGNREVLVGKTEDA